MGHAVDQADPLSADGATIGLTGLQKDVCEALSSRERLLVVGDMGAERVLPILLHFGTLVLSGEIERALLVAPSSELAMWERAIQTLTSDRRCLVRDSMTLSSYERLSRKDSRYQRDCWRAWDFLLLDEGNRISNPSSNVAQYFVGRGKALGLASKARYRYILGDMPLDGSHVADLWAPLRFLLDEDWPCWQYRDFRERYLSSGSAGGVANGSPEAGLLAIVAQHSYQPVPHRTPSAPRPNNQTQLVTTRRCGRVCSVVRLDFRTMIEALEWHLTSAFLQEYSDLVAELATQKLDEFNRAHGANLVEHCAQNHNCESLSWPKDFPLGSQRLIGVPLTLDAVRQVKGLWRDIFDESMGDARALLGMTDADVGAMQERILFERVNREFGHIHRVLAHGRPDWLRPQHLDLWLPDVGAAIEFHGAQHFVPVEYFGGEAGFAQQRLRDLRKRQLCEANGCRLIVVDADYEWPTLKALLDRLFDGARDAATEDLTTLEYLGAESELAKLIQSTMEDHAQVRFVYWKPDGTSAHRVITPIRFEAARGTQCVRGYCWLRKAERLFALSRMKDVTTCSSDQ